MKLVFVLLYFFFIVSLPVHAKVEIATYKSHSWDNSWNEFISNEIDQKNNNNMITDVHIEKIMEIFDSKKDVDHIAKSVDNTAIAANDYNLSVSSYVEAKDNREKIDIKELNKEVTKTVEKIDRLRADIDAIINEIEL